MEKLRLIQCGVGGHGGSWIRNTTPQSPDFDLVAIVDADASYGRYYHRGSVTIGIICHGGLIPISAGIMKGRRATGSLGIKDDIVNAGGTWVDEAAFREGNRVWGRVVADIPDFCRELVQALVERVDASQAR